MQVPPKAPYIKKTALQTPALPIETNTELAISPTDLSSLSYYRKALLLEKKNWLGCSSTPYINKSHLLTCAGPGRAFEILKTKDHKPGTGDPPITGKLLCQIVQTLLFGRGDMLTGWLAFLHTYVASRKKQLAPNQRHSVNSHPKPTS